MPDLFEEIAADVATAMAREGQVIQSAIKDDLSVPVEYETGPRGGVIVIRSKRGEHPRRETGNLQDRVKTDTTSEALKTTMAVYDDATYAEYLDPKLDRPIVTGIDERFGDDVEQAVANAISGNP